MKKLLATGFFSLLLFTACGSGNTVKDYNATVGNAFNAIGSSFTAMLQELTPEMLKDKFDYAKITEVINRGATKINTELADLKEATPPQAEGVKEVQDAARTFVATYEEVMAVFHELKSAAEAKSVEKVTAANLKLLPLLGKIDEVGNKLIEAQKTMLIKNNLATESDFKE